MLKMTEDVENEINSRLDQMNTRQSQHSDCMAHTQDVIKNALSDLTAMKSNLESTVEELATVKSHLITPSTSGASSPILVPSIVAIKAQSATKQVREYFLYFSGHLFYFVLFLEHMFRFYETYFNSRF